MDKVSTPKPPEMEVVMPLTADAVKRLPCVEPEALMERLVAAVLASMVSPPVPPAIRVTPEAPMALMLLPPPARERTSMPDTLMPKPVSVLAFCS